jgi:DNA-binding NtrC family response regulator
MTNGHAPRGHVLVADDEIAMRLSLAAALRDAGYAVDLAATGAEAMNALNAGYHDVAVLDLWMPDGDGLGVLKALRKTRPSLRVFVMTGGGPGLPIEAAALISDVWGAERVFIKPFDEAALVDALARSGD